MDSIDEFDMWNIQKKNIDSFSTARFYREGEIWWISLGKNIGYEQNGKGSCYERPVLIVRAFSRFVCLIVPLTSSKKINPYHYEIGIIDGKKSYAIISQIRLIDTRRLTNRIIKVKHSSLIGIRKAIRDLF